MATKRRSAGSPPETAPQGSDSVQLSILERRLQHPFEEPSTPVLLRDPTTGQPCGPEVWAVRWCNSALSADRIWRLRSYKGWVPVRIEELAAPDQIGGLTTSAEGMVTRGEREQEVLMKMPAAMYRQIQLAKAQHLDARLRSTTRTRQEVVEEVGAAFGGEAAGFAHEHFVGQVKTDLPER